MSAENYSFHRFIIVSYEYWRTAFRIPKSRFRRNWTRWNVMEKKRKAYYLRRDVLHRRKNNGYAVR